jgi:hypothetical protein
MDLATFWALFSQTHLVTLLGIHTFLCVSLLALLLQGKLENVFELAEDDLKRFCFLKMFGKIYCFFFITPSGLPGGIFSYQKYQFG